VFRLPSSVLRGLRPTAAEVDLHAQPNVPRRDAPGARQDVSNFMVICRMPCIPAESFC